MDIKKIIPPGGNEKAIKNMNKSLPVKSRKSTNNKVIEKRPVGRPTIWTEDLRNKVLELVATWFFTDTIAGKAGIWKARINEELRKNEEFASSFTHARSLWIADKQRQLEQYAKQKKEKDWRAIKYLLTIASKEFSERKYLTEAVANQDAKINLQINAEKLTIAQSQGMKLIGSNRPEDMSLLPFDPKRTEKKAKK